MKFSARMLLALALCLSAAPAFAVDPMPFRDAREEARFRALAAEAQRSSQPLRDVAARIVDSPAEA